MEKTPRLYSELVELLGQPRQWRDRRHLQTLAWMVVRLIQTSCVNLTAWVPFVNGRARYAQSTQRRFARWLGNPRVEVQELYGPLIEQALREWGKHTLYLALDTSMLWNQYCLIRLSLVYRGRAVPLVWEVVEHGSSSVPHTAYEALLDAVPPLFAGGEGGVPGRSRLCRYGVDGAPAPIRVAFPDSDQGQLQCPASRARAV